MVADTFDGGLLAACVHDPWNVALVDVRADYNEDIGHTEAAGGLRQIADFMRLVLASPQRMKIHRPVAAPTATDPLIQWETLTAKRSYAEDDDGALVTVDWPPSYPIRSNDLAGSVVLLSGPVRDLRRPSMCDYGVVYVAVAIDESQAFPGLDEDIVEVAGRVVEPTPAMLRLCAAERAIRRRLLHRRILLPQEIENLLTPPLAHRNPPRFLWPGAVVLVLDTAPDTTSVTV